ncbi:MAG: ferredoxin [Sphaerisporangium sp.]|nr:ferredoxin [Sphaerisporangium sp.]
MANAVKETVWDPFDPIDIEDPYPSYRRLRDEYPLYYNPKRDFWAISRFSDVEEAIRNWEVYSHRNGIDLDATASTMGEGNLLEADPPQHTALRRFARAYITPKRFLSLEPLVRGFLNGLLSRLDGVHEFNVVAELCWALPVRVNAALVGLTDVPEAVTLIKAALHRVPDQVEMPAEAVEAVVALRSLLLDIVKDRRKSPKEDFISIVANGEIDGKPITDTQALGMLMLVWTAGLETTAGLLSSIFYHLSGRPDLRQELLADPQLVPNAIEEFVRFDGSIQNVMRTTPRPVTVYGVEIPADARVSLVTGAANRDERRYEDPDTLDIHRKIGRHLGFSEGLHACIGAPSARMQSRIVLQEFLPGLGEFGLGRRQERMVKQNARGFETLDLVRHW